MGRGHIAAPTTCRWTRSSKRSAVTPITRCSSSARRRTLDPGGAVPRGPGRRDGQPRRRAARVGSGGPAARALTGRAPRAGPRPIGRRCVRGARPSRNHRHDHLRHRRSRAAAAQELIEAGWFVLDVRTDAEWAAGSHRRFHPPAAERGGRRGSAAGSPNPCWSITADGGKGWRVAQYLKQPGHRVSQPRRRPLRLGSRRPARREVAVEPQHRSSRCYVDGSNLRELAPHGGLRGRSARAVRLAAGPPTDEPDRVMPA